jgi:hypothetical protein
MFRYGDVELTMSLKYLYSDSVKEFAAVSVIGLEVDITGNGSIRSEGRKTKEKSTSSHHEQGNIHRQIQSFASFAASSSSDAPTLSLDRNIDLSSFVEFHAQDLRLSDIPQFLHFRAQFEYFDHMFLAKWASIPVSIVQGSRVTTSHLHKRATPSSKQNLLPSMVNESVATSVNMEATCSRAPRLNTLPKYEAVPLSEPDSWSPTQPDLPSNINPLSLESSSFHEPPVSFEDDEPPQFDLLPGQALSRDTIPSTSMLNFAPLS